MNRSGYTNVLVHIFMVQGNKQSNYLIKGVLIGSGAVISLVKFMQESTTLMATPKFA